MKKLKRVLPVILAAVLLATVLGCSSSVTIRQLVPAEIDMSNYRIIGVASTTPYAGVVNYNNIITPRGSFFAPYTIYSSYNPAMQQQAAQYAQSMILNALRGTGYFTSIYGPEQTDLLINSTALLGQDLASQARANTGIQAYIRSQITGMTISEVYYPETTYEREREYNPFTDEWEYVEVEIEEWYCYQSVTLQLSYSVVDAATGRTIATKSLPAGMRSQSIRISSPYGSFVYAQSPYSMYQNILDGYATTIASQLAPSYVYFTTNLMDNNPNNEIAARGYEFVDNGDYSSAYNIFIEAWNTSRHVPSGYNAAICLQALGRLDDGIALLEQVYAASGNADVASRLASMRTAKNQQNIAESQLSGQ